TLEGEGRDIEQVDFFAHYEDFDREGNGLYRQWHYHYRHGRISGHIGSVRTPPYALTWHADWLPEQKRPIQLAARIKNSDGLYYMTEVVGDIALERSRRFVALYTPFEIPARWQTRSGSSRHSNRVFVPHNLHNAVSARLLMVTWSGAHAEQIGINDVRVADRVGRLHDYSYDEIEVPIELLKTGNNTFFTTSNTEHHGIEVLWPGIALKVAYADRPQSIPAGDALIFADVLGPGWQQGAITRTEADLQSTEHSFQGIHSIAIEGDPLVWQIAFERTEPLGLGEHSTLHLALHPQDVDTSKTTRLSLYLDKQSVSLLARERSAGGIDLGVSEWQVVDIPLREFDLRFPYVESLAISGRFNGQIFVDDIRLAHSPSSTFVAENARAPVPDFPRLLPSYPNPFNAQTTLRFVLGQEQLIELIIYDILGQHLRTVASGHFSAGSHQIHWDGRDGRGRALTSGIYFYQLESHNRLETHKMVLLK
ncbi:MAG: hypothetical protein ACI8PG_004583, partial [Planctomycetota bacterium]